MLGYIAIGIIKLLGMIPFSTAQSIGAFIGKRMMKRRTRMREVARVNLSLVYPGKSEGEREALLHETLIQTGKTLGETGPMWGYDSAVGAGLIRKVHGEALFDELMTHEGGKVLIAPHLGNWEIINNYVAQKQQDITIMYRPLKSQTLNSWMVNKREAVGCKLVPTTRQGVEGLFETLRAGELVGFLPDQEPRPQSGVFAPFMGHPALTPKLPHEMLTKTGSKAIYAFAKRLPDSAGFELYFLPTEDALYSESVEESAASMNKGIAECIAICPDQYQWGYKRFKRQPEGMKNPYSGCP